MQKTAVKNKVRNNDYDLYGDLQKIKSILADATYGARGKAEEMISQKLEEMKEKTAVMQEDAGQYVAERPFKSVGVAFAIGALVGLLAHKIW